MSNLNQKIAAKITALAANAAAPVTASREEVLAGRVIAALKTVGIDEQRVHAALDDGTDADTSGFTPVTDANPVTDEEVEAACRLVLAELGVDVEEEGQEDEEDGALLDQISDLTAQLVANAGGDSKRLFRASSRLTASLNLTVVAAGQKL